MLFPNKEQCATLHGLHCAHDKVRVLYYVEKRRYMIAVLNGSVLAVLVTACHRVGCHAVKFPLSLGEMRALGRRSRALGSISPSHTHIPCSQRQRVTLVTAQHNLPPSLKKKKLFA